MIAYKQPNYNYTTTTTVAATIDSILHRFPPLFYLSTCRSQNHSFSICISLLTLFYPYISIPSLPPSCHLTTLHLTFLIFSIRFYPFNPYLHPIMYSNNKDNVSPSLSNHILWCFISILLANQQLISLRLASFGIQFCS